MRGPHDDSTLPSRVVLAQAHQRVPHGLERRPWKNDQVRLRGFDEPPGRIQLVGLLNRVTGELEDAARRLSKRLLVMNQENCVTHADPGLRPVESTTATLQLLYAWITGLLHRPPPATGTRAAPCGSRYRLPIRVRVSTQARELGNGAQRSIGRTSRAILSNRRLQRSLRSPTRHDGRLSVCVRYPGFDIIRHRAADL